MFATLQWYENHIHGRRVKIPIGIISLFRNGIRSRDIIGLLIKVTLLESNPRNFSSKPLCLQI